MVNKEFKVAYQIETPVGFLPLERGRPVRRREDRGIRKLLPADREENTRMHVSVSMCVDIFVIYFSDRYLSDIYICDVYLYLSIYLPIYPSCSI